MTDLTRDELLRSYYRVRQALGYVGLLLPILLVLGGLLSRGHVEPSISDYYHTVLRDIFVGTICAISLFLITYPGHRRRPGEAVSDDLVTTLAGFAGLGVALFPNDVAMEGGLASVTQVLFGARVAAICHYVSAAVFLGSLAHICLVKFVRTASPVRRRIYRLCGRIIAVMTVGVVLASLVKINGPPGPRALVIDWMVVLWCEAIAVWAFSVSWLVKGRAEMVFIRLFSAAGKDPERAGMRYEDPPRREG